MEIGTVQPTIATDYVLAGVTTPIRIWSIVIKGASNAAAIVFTPDENAVEIERVALPGTATVAYRSWPGGLLVSGGCVIETDGNGTYCTVCYSKE